MTDLRRDALFSAGQAIRPGFLPTDSADEPFFVADGIPLGRRDELVGGGLKRYIKLSGSSESEAYDERVLGCGEFVEQLWQKTERLEECPVSTASNLLNEIIGRVAFTFGIEAAAVCNGSKRKEVADARAAICFLAARQMGFCGVEVAKKVKLTRSAVVHAAIRGEAIFKDHPELYTAYMSLSNSTKTPTSP
jgi:putative transposase